MNNEASDIVTFGTSAFLMTLKDGSVESRIPADEPFFMFRGNTFPECEGADFWNLSDTEYHYLLKYSDLG